MQQTMTREQTGSTTSFTPWAAGGKGTVLVVDDEPAVATICTKMIRALGYPVRTAAGGAEALAMASASKTAFALVLLDRHLPDMAMEAVAEGLRRIDGQIRILVQSGDPLSPDDPDLNLVGICGYLQKPYGFRELAETLDQVLSAGYGGNRPGVRPVRRLPVLSGGGGRHG